MNLQIFLLFAYRVSCRIRKRKPPTSRPHRLWCSPKGFTPDGNLVPRFSPATTLGWLGIYFSFSSAIAPLSPCC